MIWNTTINRILTQLFAFQLLDEKKIQKADDLYKDFETPEAASKV